MLEAGGALYEVAVEAVCRYADEGGSQRRYDRAKEQMEKLHR